MKSNRSIHFVSQSYLSSFWHLNREYVEEISPQTESVEVISDDTLPASFEESNVPSFEDLIKSSAQVLNYISFLGRTILLLIQIIRKSMKTNILVSIFDIHKTFYLWIVHPRPRLIESLKLI